MLASGDDQSPLDALSRCGVRDPVVQALYRGGMTAMGDVFLAAQSHRDGHDDLRSLTGIDQQSVGVLLAAIDLWRLNERRELFYQPDCNAAYEQWCRVTNLDRTSPEWGEVWQVLRDSELLYADRLAQPGLFDDPAAGEPPGVRQLRLAIVAGAQYWRESTYRHDLGTSTALAAVFASTFVEELGGLAFDPAVTWLTGALRARVLKVVASPSEALGWRLAEAFAQAQPGFGLSFFAAHYGELLAILREVVGHDEFARRAFEPLSRRFGVGLLALATGDWVVYASSPATEVVPC